MRPDVLAVQEVGDPAALDDLTERVGGSWHVALSEQPDERGIRVGFMSRAAARGRRQRSGASPSAWRPCSVEDDGETTAEMGRGGLAVRVGGDRRSSPAI